jgi:hypothetical protein
LCISSAELLGFSTEKLLGTLLRVMCCNVLWKDTSKVRNPDFIVNLEWGEKVKKKQSRPNLK